MRHSMYLIFLAGCLPSELPTYSLDTSEPTSTVDPTSGSCELVLSPDYMAVDLGAFDNGEQIVMDFTISLSGDNCDDSGYEVDASEFDEGGLENHAGDGAFHIRPGDTWLGQMPVEVSDSAVPGAAGCKFEIYNDQGAPLSEPKFVIVEQTD